MPDLTYNSFSLGTINFPGDRIYGYNGPDFPEIQVTASLYLNAYEEELQGDNSGAGEDEAPERRDLAYTVLSIEGDLKMKTGRERSRPICHLNCNAGPFHVERRHQDDVSLVGRLTPHHANSIEKHRGEGNVELEISCALSIHFEHPPEGQNRFNSVREVADVTMPRSHWTDNVYPGIGGREVFVIEIPKGSKSIDRAWSKIEDAKQAFSNWSTEGTMIACREAADVLQDTMKEHYGEDSCVYKHRWDRAFNGLKAQASLGGHFEHIRENVNCERPEELQITRADLECLIIRTQAMLKYTEALLREKEG
jgi:hypothetical protein